MQKIPFFIILGLTVFGLNACSGVQTEAKYPTSIKREASTTGNEIHGKPDSIFGSGGMFGDKKDGEDSGGGSGIAVNSFLWRASLDTVSFMPLASADPFGGTILTDWYSPEGVTDEQFKINVFILTRELRSDGIRVRVFKQKLNKKGAWVDSEASDETARQLEDTILTRARQLRVAQLGE